MTRENVDDSSLVSIFHLVQRARRLRCSRLECALPQLSSSKSLTLLCKARAKDGPLAPQEMRSPMTKEKHRVRPLLPTPKKIPASYTWQNSGVRRPAVGKGIGQNSDCGFGVLLERMEDHLV